ncbi:MAG: hypothetical protein ACRDJF_07690 [Actinomycetota bacterium]
MKIATTVAQMLLRLTGVILLILGLAFWTGRALDLVAVHLLVGLVFVLALWALAVLGALAHVPSGFVAATIAWGLIVAILGLSQDELVTGSAHRVIEVLHLLVGLAAIGLGEGLGARIKGRRAPALQP